MGKSRTNPVRLVSVRAVLQLYPPAALIESNHSSRPWILHAYRWHKPDAACQTSRSLAGLSDPVKFKLESLLFHFRRDEVVRQGAGELLRGAHEQVDWRNIKNLCLPTDAVSGNMSSASRVSSQDSRVQKDYTHPDWTVGFCEINRRCHGLISSMSEILRGFF
jgi:hypothetical protein